MIKPLYRIYLPDIDQVSSSPAIAGYGEVAGLGVQGEHGQVHGAPQGQGHLHIHVNTYHQDLTTLLFGIVDKSRHPSRGRGKLGRHAKSREPSTRTFME